jgi:hypothetical protein
MVDGEVSHGGHGGFLVYCRVASHAVRPFNRLQAVFERHSDPANRGPFAWVHAWSVGRSRSPGSDGASYHTGSLQRRSDGHLKRLAD